MCSNERAELEYDGGGVQSVEDMAAKSRDRKQYIDDVMGGQNPDLLREVMQNDDEIDAAVLSLVNYELPESNLVGDIPQDVVIPMIREHMRLINLVAEKLGSHFDTKDICRAPAH